MIICFKCSTETKELLDRLLALGQYKDYAEIISVALVNLEALQGELVDKAAIVINDEKTELKTSTPQEKKNEAQLAHQNLNIPAIFLLDGISDYEPSIAPLPDDVWVTGQEVPLDRWLFGQYNKVLPTKANCRALAHLVRQEPKGPLLEKASNIISNQAILLGNYLKFIDVEKSITRDEALSTAFPFASENTEKSRLRYTNQFIASVNKQGQVSGLLMGLKFINHTGGNTPRLLLTDIGWRFAKLANPILDSNSDDLVEKFSEKEIKFLLEHISQSVPAEDFAFRTILSAILEGANTPEKIDSHLLKYINKDSRLKLSESFFSTQRSGAISRMSDLRLVERVRDGVRVSYNVTENGEKYLKEFST